MMDERVWKTLLMLFIRGEEAMQYYIKRAILKYHQLKRM